MLLHACIILFSIFNFSLKRSWLLWFNFLHVFVHLCFQVPIFFLLNSILSYLYSFYSRFYFIFEFFFLWNDIKWNLPLLTAFMFQNQSSIQLFLVYTCYEKGILLLMPSNFECQVPTAISFWILYPSLTGTCCWSNLFWDFGNHSIHPLFLSFQMVIPDFMNSKEKNRLLMRTGTKRKWRSSGCWKAKRWKIIWAATIKVMKRWTFAPRYA